MRGPRTLVLTSLALFGCGASTASNVPLAPTAPQAALSPPSRQLFGTDEGLYIEVSPHQLEVFASHPSFSFLFEADTLVGPHVAREQGIDQARLEVRGSEGAYEAALHWYGDPTAPMNFRALAPISPLDGAVHRAIAASDESEQLPLEMTLALARAIQGVLAENWIAPETLRFAYAESLIAITRSAVFHACHVSAETPWGTCRIDEVEVIAAQRAAQELHEVNP